MYPGWIFAFHPGAAGPFPVLLLPSGRRGGSGFHRPGEHGIKHFFSPLNWLRVRELPMSLCELPQDRVCSERSALVHLCSQPEEAEAEGGSVPPMWGTKTAVSSCNQSLSLRVQCACACAPARAPLHQGLQARRAAWGCSCCRAAFLQLLWPLPLPEWGFTANPPISPLGLPLHVATIRVASSGSASAASSLGWGDQYQAPGPDGGSSRMSLGALGYAQQQSLSHS